MNNSNNEMTFLEKEKKWTGFGEDVSDTSSSGEALEKAGLNWKIAQQDVFTMGPDGSMKLVPHTRCNVRVEDGKTLGIVGDRYRVCQNADAFAFTDSLLGSGVRYDRAGSFYGGRRIWLSATLPPENIMGDEVQPYLVFVNTHDGSGAVRVAITPHRIVCSNAINFALRTANRFWAVIHTQDLALRMQEAQNVLDVNRHYLDELKDYGQVLADIPVDNADLPALAEAVYPLPDKDVTPKVEANIALRREQLLEVYRKKDDLQDMPKTAWRFVNAVSDYATHSKPLNGSRRSAGRVLEQVVAGHPVIDRAVRLFA